MRYIRKNASGKYQYRTTVFSGPKTNYIKICLIDEEQQTGFVEIENEEQQSLPFS